MNALTPLNNTLPAPSPDLGLNRQPSSSAETRENPTNLFLQILVAQMRTQNPLEPQKGTEFVTQLAQFNTLEQLIAIRAELKALREAITPGPAAKS